ncbi:MAG: alkaline phosphatase family protein [Deltaproteobacteria bacterium]|nr:alkaline phosphatase family protein [Deltaproteobacteria bacterium]
MLHPDFVKPDYQANCFSRIPKTIQYLLTGDGALSLPENLFEKVGTRFDQVIFFLVDAFGWQFFERYRDKYPFFQHFLDSGQVARLDSQFPSTTAAHVTTIHTGLPVGQSNVFDWQYYEPKLDAIFAPLLYSTAGTRSRETLKSVKISPAEIIPSQTLYQDLKSAGVQSYIFQHRAFTPSTFSNVVFNGAAVHPYKTLSEALVNMGETVSNCSSPAYTFFYFSPLDDICHQYGPDSPQFEAEVDAFFTTLENQFFNQLAGNLKNTLFIMTADHGQTAVDPATTIYLNQDPDLIGFQKFIRSNREGRFIIPGGSCRNMIIYLKEGVQEEAHAFLSKRLQGKAEVYSVRALIDEGLFGDRPVTPGFIERAGDLMILPFKNESVWWYEKGRFEQRFYGHHGGLTPEEVQIPFLMHPF